MASFFNDHTKIFGLIEAFVVTLTMPLFVVALVHALRGNKQRFAILVTSSILLMYVFYYCFIFLFSFNKESIWGLILYSASIIMFESIHWGIAYTYFECSSTSPFNGSPTPSRKKIIGLRICFSIGLILIVISGTSSLIKSQKLKNWFYILNALMCLIIIATMIVALCRIRKTIGASPRGKANIMRMISHASAFIVAAITVLFNEYLKRYYFFATWIVDDIFLSLSQYFLYVILWHLGTKEDYSRLHRELTTEREEPVLSTHESSDSPYELNELNK